MLLLHRLIAHLDFDYCDTCHANPPSIPPEDPVLALHEETHDYLAVNQDAPTPVLDMMRHGLESRERAVVISLLTLGVSEAKEKASDLAALIQYCSDPSDDVLSEAVGRAEAFLDSLGDEGQICKDSLLCLRVYRNTQGQYVAFLLCLRPKYAASYGGTVTPGVTDAEETFKATLQMHRLLR